MLVNCVFYRMTVQRCEKASADGHGPGGEFFLLDFGYNVYMFKYV